MIYVQRHYKVVWLVVFCLLQACSKQRLYGDYAVTSLKYDLKNQPYGQLVQELRKGEKPIIPEDCFAPGVAGPDALTPPGVCEQKRNMVIGDLVAFSGELCEQHMKTIFGNEAAFNITAGTLTNIFSGAATVINGSAVKSALSAAAFFSNSERSLVNETVYKSVIVPAVVIKIETIRSKSLATLRESLKQPHKDYPIHIALLDVVEYHRSCSFMFGLQRVLEEGTRTAPATVPTATTTPTQTTDPVR